jgi:hypothetical protein
MDESETGSAANDVRECLTLLVGGMKSGDASDTLVNLERLDRIVSSKGETLDPRLAHFLANRSYAKALHFLEGEGEVPRGSCQPRNH